MRLSAGPFRDLPFDNREVWPPERWQRLQWRRLGAVLRHAYDHIPFYRRRWAAADIHPEDIRSPEDFGRVPVLRKADVLAATCNAGGPTALAGAQADGPSALGLTSGTLGTGILSFPEGWRRATGDAACRAYWWAGLRPGMQMLMAAPAWHCMAIRQTRVAERLRVRCIVPWGTFLPQFAGNFLEALRSLRPEFVCLFLPMLYALLGECRQRGIAAAEAFSSVGTVLLGGAPLTPAARRQLIAELGVRDVFDSAGSSEGLLASECSAHDGLHCFIDICYVEIVDPTTRRPLPPGQRGSLVISSLVPHGSIHLRYDTEDIGEILAGDCQCGRTWPRLRIYDRRANLVRVQGREVLWYDVRACMDEFAELVGIPFALVRGNEDERLLRLAIQKPPCADYAGVGRRAAEVLSGRLGLPLSLEWSDGLPARWKGVTVIDQKDWRQRG